jgi:hypothetical protein
MNENPQELGRGRGGGARGYFRGGRTGEEDQAYVITMMKRVTRPEIVLIQGKHGPVIPEPMDMQLNIVQS